MLFFFFLRAFTRLCFRVENIFKCLHAAVKGRAKDTWDKARSLRVYRQSLDMKEGASFSLEPRQFIH